METVTKSFVFDDGGSVDFVRLTLGDLFSLADSAQAEREKIARQVGKEEGLTKIDVINLVLDIRTHKPSVHEILESCGSAQGAYTVIVKSLLKAGIATEKHDGIISRISIPDALDLARLLVLDVQEGKAEEKKEEQLPLSVNPTTSVNTNQEKIDAKLASVGFYGQNQSV